MKKQNQQKEGTFEANMINEIILEINYKKYCPACDQTKNVDEFYNQSSYCKPCRRSKERIYSKTTTGSDRIRNYKLKQRYGIDENIYRQMYYANNGCCYICDKPKDYKKLHTDHSHTNNKVRGLLCGKCNMALGLLNDDINIIRKVETYLRK